MNWTRRAALQFSLATLAASAGAGMSFAKAPGMRSKQKLILVILRGALDGLSAVAPLQDETYMRLRPNIGLTNSSGSAPLLPVSDGFALHPRLNFLHSVWAEKRLAILHAAATPYRSRSHFDAQDILENGGVETFGQTDGWLNRALSELSGGKGIAVSQSIPLVLKGKAPALNYAPSFLRPAQEDTLIRLMDMYDEDAMLGPLLADAIEISELVGEADMQGGQRRSNRNLVAWPKLAKNLTDLMIAPRGPSAGVLSFDGWDTHYNQGAWEGNLPNRLEALDKSLQQIKVGMGEIWPDTTVLVVSEFGRTVAENGTKGTDHGTGGVAFLLGGSVNGGRFLGDWPGLKEKDLFEGRDLMPVNDVRRLFKGVIAQQWGLSVESLDNVVFPGSQEASPLSGLIV